MLDKMILGRFVPLQSFVHRLDPRMKMVFVFIMMILIFLMNNWQSYAVGIILIFIILKASNLSFMFLFNGLKPILFLLIFTLLMHVFLTKGGTTLVDYGIINIQSQGVIMGIMISLRFILIIFLTTIMTLTTSPIELTDAIESLLKPFKKLKLPVHELALMMSIALRFIPTLMDETQKVMKAQMSRGSDMTAGTLKERIKAVIPLLVPLFVSAFKRAEDLAIAMEVRGYKGDVGRTKYRKLDWHTYDTLSLLTLIPITLLILYLKN
ncbi:energy-coupling factor transporter transmembrane protein EcfT [Macrococcus caseolyticus]|uniref:Energy-coupling factor transporter transmembrane protein EcfT n=1 Tax=Macrococcoides caseolyticum TaxID=69966 RepID=A0A1S7BGU8_9STAP|nr:energy-coupling factor transporter transmembrane protein EcfT [Macrococcus caseolyticus]AQX82915.1 putative membrane protein CbiQ [Macrococcus caseolyticus]AQX82943.1 putative membrane protein CbiQ [Macrococcus caseolyticus]MDJ1089195.1 energy-coupling factor transporter transmembrane protein EcfT [Macrococcus caseolyticus]MDJ1091589.1 energy-coupling factor transporter transmembrane protein EcfT [Macrococcus caseolyticus]MDJ1153333.1 energy-coupling factor transporter transmembrane protein